MNPRLTLTEHQRRAEAVNNVLEDIIRGDFLTLSGPGHK